MPSSFFITNLTTGVTAGNTWQLTVPLLKESNWERSGRFPCNPSLLLPDDPTACDVGLYGEQTEYGDATVILEEFSYGVPRCCPDTAVRWSDAKPGACCNDNLSQNPYK